MSRSLTALVVAFVLGLEACGSDDGGPTAPERSEPQQLQVTGEWSRAREATFEDATWRFFRILPTGHEVTEIGGDLWEAEPIMNGPIGRDGSFTVLLPNDKCWDTANYEYYVSVSGRYAANMLRCSALAPVECTEELQHIAHWNEHGSCVPGAEPASVTVTLDITVTWNGGGAGSWELGTYASAGHDSPIVYDRGHIPESGVFKIETTLTCPIDYDWSLRNLYIRATISQNDRVVRILGDPVECTDAAQVREWGLP